jgi:NADP-dependent 3-hydroxy acid dehydrogenase YdfG
MVFTSRALAGRVAPIPGGGLGLCITRTFAQIGVLLVLASRSVDRLTNAVDEIRALGEEAIAVGTDHSHEQVENAVNNAIKRRRS